MKKARVLFELLFCQNNIVLVIKELLLQIFVRLDHSRVSGIEKKIKFVFLKNSFSNIKQYRLRFILRSLKHDLFLKKTAEATNTSLS